jgi:hypothetical protein
MITSIMRLAACLLVLVASPTMLPAVAADGPKTPEALATMYMDSFNKKDKAAINKLRYPSTAKSDMQSMMDEIAEAEMSSGTQYNKFEVTPIKAEMTEPKMGPDGVFYKPVIKPTHMVKFIAKTENGTSSTSMPVGPDKGVYYIATIIPAPGAQPAYKFGWGRFTMPGTTWSVMLPNEPEPGRAALEKEGGPDALKDPDAYGVVKNTASIKTAQHWFWCGEEGKRVNAPDNEEHYRAACTTYEPETLKEWFSDPKKTLDEAVQLRVREDDGKLVSVKEIDLNGAPGREFEIQGKDGKLKLGRAYWIKDALYELTFDSKKETPNREGAEKFLGSLQVQ